MHESVADALLARLGQIYQSIAIGDPLQEGTLVGPLIDRAAFDAMQQALAQARAEGGQVLGGERVREDLGQEAWYVRPALVQMPQQSTSGAAHETFAPILYMCCATTAIPTWPSPCRMLCPRVCRLPSSRRA